jgi:hypothetical protein
MVYQADNGWEYSDGCPKAILGRRGIIPDVVACATSSDCGACYKSKPIEELNSPGIMQPTAHLNQPKQ